MFAGAAFPFMLMLILSASILSFAGSSGDIALYIVIVAVGEILLLASYFIFGRQSGITSVRRHVQNTKKRQIGTKDKSALLGVGEYSAYKGFVMGLISCVPYIIVQIIYCSVPNKVCEFMLVYLFGWAFYPLYFTGLAGWINLVLIVFPIGVHGGAYIFGAHKEWDKQRKVFEMQNGDKKGK